MGVQINLGLVYQMHRGEEQGRGYNAGASYVDEKAGSRLRPGAQHVKSAGADKSEVAIIMTGVARLAAESVFLLSDNNRALHPSSSFPFSVSIPLHDLWHGSCRPQEAFQLPLRGHCP